VAPAVRGVARVAPLSRVTARGRASVVGAIDPRLRSAPPWVPPPPRRRPLDVEQPAEAPQPAAEEPGAAGPAAREPAANGPVAERPTGLKPATNEPEPVGEQSKGEPSQTEPSQTERSQTEQSKRSPAANPDVDPKPSRLLKRGKRVILPIAAALLAAFVGGTGYLMIKEPPATGDVGRWTGTPQAAPSAVDAAPFAVPVDGAGADPFGTKGPALTGVPTRLKVDAIDLDTSLETLRIGADGALTPPKDFGKAGWYADGTRPGDTGPAVIAGHVDSRRGPAVFYDLRKVTEGDRIEVIRGGRSVRFTVVSTAWYPKTDFPTDEVYGPTPDRQLRLITCGGVFDRRLRSYNDNLVVYAVAG
jgi:hypothetical protein